MFEASHLFIVLSLFVKYTRRPFARLLLFLLSHLLFYTTNLVHAYTFVIFFYLIILSEYEVHLFTLK